jgi:transposase InsO family protein
MRTELIEEALKDAQGTRGSLTGAIFHNDHGSQYTSKDFAKLCTRLGVTQSMSAVGTSADNALAEAFNATFKRETLAGATTLAGRGHLPSSGVPLGHALQHPPTPLLLRRPQPERLREPRNGYTHERGITITPRVQDPGSRPHRTYPADANKISPLSTVRDWLPPPSCDPGPRPGQTGEKRYSDGTGRGGPRNPQRLRGQTG